ncbi:hypothetical protein KAU11_00305 [Candidatus Babeliales bacterium]|nr:hypothetical protein [Candidatus Babeliales bacterium]
MKEGETAEKILAFERAELQNLLNQCTKKQQMFFKRIFPKGVQEEQLSDAIKLCERTLIRNKR